jgi:hypothetical protein
VSDTVYTALISGLVTVILVFLGFWITFKTSTFANKQVMRYQAASKKAEFRQQWIENLRQSVAGYLADASTLVHAQTGMISQENYRTLVEKTEYIELLLNHHEDDAKDLIDKLRLTLDKATTIKIDPKGDFYKARKEAAAAARKILKAEWEILKSELDAVEGKK